MAYLDYRNRIKRVDFSKIDTVLPIPNLIKVQQESYEEFLQKDVAPEKRRIVGLQSVFKNIFPISDYNGRADLEFVSYDIGQPKWSEEECRERGYTYAAPIKLHAQIVTYDVDERTGAKTIRDLKDQEVFFGDIPLMSERATFIINGTERVIVSQLHRSPGVFFEHDKGRSHASGKILFSARVIPYRGSWLDFEFDHKDMLYLKIDRKRKFPIAVLLRAFGKTTEELLRLFYDVEDVTVEGNTLTKPFRPEIMQGVKMPVEVRTLSGEVAFKKGVKVTQKRIERFRREGAAFGNITLPVEDLENKVSVTDVADPATGEVVVECGQQITAEILQKIRDCGVGSLSVFSIESERSDRAVWEGLVTDKIRTRDEALKEIYKKMRPGDPPTKDASETLFENLFFNADRYSLSRVGRLKLNHKLGIKDGDLDLTVLTQDDIIRVIRYLIDLKNGVAGTEADDIDNLGNRRVRTVGELIENQFRSGLVRVDRAIKEKMAIQDIETLMPHDLINAKPVTAMIKEFFGSSQLSQFMDQTNPLSEVTHKRRVSALGPGGLTRDRAGFEVRDVHPTHYGRICPIETPEGPNIGLIASLSTFARINDFGFIETPYRVVKDGCVTEEIIYLTAMDEDPHVIAQANAGFEKKTGRLTDDVTIARKKGDFTMVRSAEVTLMDVSPNQLVSVAASMVPFLEHDDANRALMGSNMQRQAVPLLRTEPPFVGTGMEPVVARDSGAAVTARRAGVIESADAKRIVVRANEPDEAGKYGADIYNLVKYRRSNQNTCINQKPIVTLGQSVARDEVLADGPATHDGDLALGRNVLVAFMPWGGYNFEDSILVNEKIIKEDIFTSIHIEEFECFARETKLGKEEITADIPNISEESLKDLDEGGIVRIGARVKPMDILVGKVTPKGETQLTPEEKLLRAIFGEKAGDVKDSSLRVPPGVDGIVIDAKVFTRKGSDKDESSSRFEEKEHERLLRDQDDEIRITFENACAKIRHLVLGKTLGGRIVDDEGRVLAAKKKKITEELLDEIPREYWGQLSSEEDAGSKELVSTLFKEAQDQIHLTRAVFEEKISRLKKGDELPPGVLKMVKVYIAMKRKLSVGDKMAGRHGNKGVISRVLPEEDMPYLADGTPVDIVLNPLGVPSRMNVGQIMEAHLGWAAMGLSKQFREMVDRETSPKALRERMLAIHKSPRFRSYLETLDDEQVVNVAKKYAEGVHVATPVFAGATEDEIKEVLRQAGLPDSGQVNLFDGKTGNLFQAPVTVGSMYMLKLHHLVDDKIHARSTGPYSLVTQQPLGGKAQFGGQRLGEMEVWALEAYGAAYTLQEFLTVKSDDVPGRARMYEAIVKGNFSLEPGLPESFNVLIKELQALGLNVELNGDEPEPPAQTANR